MPKWDGLKPLPGHVVAPLLRALACIPRTAEARLVLRKAQERRRPVIDPENDFDVVFRDRKVGRIWRYDYRGAVSGPRAEHLWHGYIRNVEDHADVDSDAPTLEAAMADFRAAWDAPGTNVRNLHTSSGRADAD